MPKAYAVVTYRSISDPEKLAAYARLAAPAVAPFGARFLARGDAAVAREHGVKERTVVVEYPSLEKATAAYDSSAYAEALNALGDGAVRDFRIVEGIE
jgi:uncharacterized protein (DUF1330 family)